MYRKIVWCYVIVLALLDISLNTKLSAQGKSHGNGVSVHESLMEGISLQEWGKESVEEAGARGGGGGLVAPPDAVSLHPPALEFGRAALAAAHARTVTITNTGNETIHLASVAGTTHHFHASFFESKTLVPQANTTFSVVYLGRREGPIATHLFIHTSRGMLRYPVSAEGVASPWRVWPLVGLRVPLNATLEPTLTLYNPTDTTIQVSEVYSSGSWVQLRLPDGGESAPRLLWTLPPHATRDLVRLRVRAPHHHHPHHIAYIRIKANMTGGGLVVGVEACGAAHGEYLHPLQLRLRTRGTRDPPQTFTLEAGNSEARGVRLTAGVWGARCAASPPDPPHPPAPTASSRTAANGGVKESGAHMTLTREYLEAHQQPVSAASLTLDFGALYAGAESLDAARGAWCAGWARVGRAAVPYSLRVHAGTVAFTPPEMHFVTGSSDNALMANELYASNEFQVPVHIEHIEFPPEVEEYFHTESLAPLVVGGGRGAAVARLRLRTEPAPVSPLRAALTVRTNLTDYTLPLLLYDGMLQFEWEWTHAGSVESLKLGAVSAMSTRRVLFKLHNRGVAPLCVTALRAALPGGSVSLRTCPQKTDERSCVAPGEYCVAELTVVAPGRSGPVSGEVSVSTRHADSSSEVSFHVHSGRVVALPVAIEGAAPYVWGDAPLQLDSTMQLAMRVTHLMQREAERDYALLYLLPEDETLLEVVSGRSSVGRLVYAPESECEPRCSTGLMLDSADGIAWLDRAMLSPEKALPIDAALLAARKATFVPGRSNISALLYTTQVAGISVSGTVRRAWPTLAGAVGGARLAAVGGAGVLRVRVRNPAARPLAMHPVIAGAEGGGACPERACHPASFSLGEWHAAAGHVATWIYQPLLLLLQPGAELELTVVFAPRVCGERAATLYLRNNLTILETVPLSGRGAVPSYDLGGRKPNTTAPILLEVSECGSGGGHTVRRALSVRNTGAVPVRLRDWRVAGAPCSARGFRVHPCATLALAPNESKAIEVAFTSDWTRARAQAVVSARVGSSAAEWSVAAVTPARLIARCGQRMPQPPFESALRTVGNILAFAALALVVSLATLDAERALRRHRCARESPPTVRAPLDLRALAQPEPAPAPAPAPASAPPPAKRRRTPRRRTTAADGAAERLAFERWRAEVSRRAPPSSEEGEENGADTRPPPPAAAPPSPPPPQPQPRGDASSSEPDSSPTAPRKTQLSNATHYANRRRAADNEPPSSGSESSERSERSERSEAEDGSPGRGADVSPSQRREGSAPLHDAGDGAHAPPALPHSKGTIGSSRRESDRAHESRGAPGECRVRTRSGSARSGGRKERAARRRSRAHSPPHAVPPLHATGGAGERAPPAVRWGASWSSVVSRGAAPEPAGGAGPAPAAAPAPLPPIGSDVPRRSDNSLFYYGSASRDPAWEHRPAQQHQHRTNHYNTGTEDANNGFRSLESVWGASMEPHPAAAAWLWGVPPPLAPTPVRPPPGFSPREYDPFHSLASIWTPAALDWRARHHTPTDGCDANDDRQKE